MIPPTWIKSNIDEFGGDFPVEITLGTSIAPKIVAKKQQCLYQICVYETFGMNLYKTW